MRVDAAAYSLLDCATAIWHFAADWIPYAEKITGDAKKSFLAAICRKCPPILICRDICIGYKHVEATRTSPVTKIVRDQRIDIGPSLRVASAAIGEEGPTEIEPQLVVRFYVFGNERAANRYSVRDVLYNTLEFLPWQ